MELNIGQFISHIVVRAIKMTFHQSSNCVDPILRETKRMLNKQIVDQIPSETVFQTRN